ncbi:MAG: alkylmercury lyase family protein [Candidatus Binatia bacterium]|nr:alkylmercury lyase family protein [Candidatus Binatia bacterium]
MPQNVPEFRFSDAALKVRQFIYEYWCTHGRAPNLRAVHEATGLSRREIAEAYKELDLGIMCVVDLTTQNLNILKAPPFSSYPTPAEIHVGNRFLAYAGCAMESLAVSMMPPLRDQDVRIEGYCAQCLGPVRLLSRNGELLNHEPASLAIHVSSSPREWNTTNIVHMCDSMNFVCSREHAEAYERAICRRGVLFSLEQALRFVTPTGKSRMWQYDRPPDYLRPDRVLDFIRSLGVDVSGWGE